MDAEIPCPQQIASHFRLQPRLLRLAVTAGWLEGNRSAERAHRSCWIVADQDAAIAAALAFLQLNKSSGWEKQDQGALPPETPTKGDALRTQ